MNSRIGDGGTPMIELRIEVLKFTERPARKKSWRIYRKRRSTLTLVFAR